MHAACSRLSEENEGFQATHSLFVLKTERSESSISLLSVKGLQLLALGCWFAPCPNQWLSTTCIPKLKECESTLATEASSNPRDNTTTFDHASANKYNGGWNTITLHVR